MITDVVIVDHPTPRHPIIVNNLRELNTSLREANKRLREDGYADAWVLGPFSMDTARDLQKRLTSEYEELGVKVTFNFFLP